MSNEYETGQRLLNAVEQIMAPARDIKALVARLRTQAGGDREEVDRRIVARYSNLSAAVGAAAALPSLLPGLGAIPAALAAPFVDMVYVLKLEAEMCMALFASHGYEIERAEERQLSLLLAAVHTGGVSSGRNVLLDVGAITTTAVWSYGPREITKLLLVVLGHVAIEHAAKRASMWLCAAIPFVGIGVGASVNKLLTSRVGAGARRDLALREALIAEREPAARADVAAARGRS